MKVRKLEESIAVADDVRSLTKTGAAMSLSETVRDLAQSLSGKGVKWALCGGLAVGVHANPRGTSDVDIILENDAAIDDVVRLSNSLFKKNRPHAMTNNMTGVEVEFVTPEHVNVSPGVVSTAIETAKWSLFGGIEIPVVTRSGLVAMKLERGSRQDLADIEAVIRSGSVVDVSAYGLSESKMSVLREIENDVLNIGEKTRKS